MRLYLSGPMSGIDKFNEPAFVTAAGRLRSSNHEVVVPHELDSEDRESKTWGDFIARDVKLIADGNFDAIVLLPGWEGSKGSRLELTLMILLGKRVFEFYDNRFLEEIECKDAKLILGDSL